VSPFLQKPRPMPWAKVYSLLFLEAVDLMISISKESRVHFIQIASRVISGMSIRVMRIFAQVSVGALAPSYRTHGDLPGNLSPISG
jgi:hypothetical protein